MAEIAIKPAEVSPPPAVPEKRGFMGVVKAGVEAGKSLGKAAKDKVASIRQGHKGQPQASEQSIRDIADGDLTQTGLPNFDTSSQLPSDAYLQQKGLPGFDEIASKPYAEVQRETGQVNLPGLRPDGQAALPPDPFEAHQTRMQELRRAYEAREKATTPQIPEEKLVQAELPTPDTVKEPIKTHKMPDTMSADQAADKVAEEQRKSTPPKREDRFGLLDPLTAQQGADRLQQLADARGNTAADVLQSQQQEPGIILPFPDSVRARTSIEDIHEAEELQRHQTELAQAGQQRAQVEQDELRKWGQREVANRVRRQAEDEAEAQRVENPDQPPSEPYQARPDENSVVHVDPELADTVVNGEGPHLSEDDRAMFDEDPRAGHIEHPTTPPHEPMPEERPDDEHLNVDGLPDTVVNGEGAVMPSDVHGITRGVSNEHDLNIREGRRTGEWSTDTSRHDDQDSPLDAPSYLRRGLGRTVQGTLEGFGEGVVAKRSVAEDAADTSVVSEQAQRDAGQRGLPGFGVEGRLEAMRTRTERLREAPQQGPDVLIPGPGGGLVSADSEKGKAYLESRANEATPAIPPKPEAGKLAHQLETQLGVSSELARDKGFQEAYEQAMQDALDHAMESKGGWHKKNKIDAKDVVHRAEAIKARRDMAEARAKRQRQDVRDYFLKPADESGEMGSVLSDDQMEAFIDLQEDEDFQIAFAKVSKDSLISGLTEEDRKRNVFDKAKTMSEQIKNERGNAAPKTPEQQAQEQRVKLGKQLESFGLDINPYDEAFQQKFMDAVNAEAGRLGKAGSIDTPQIDVKQIAQGLVTQYRKDNGLTYADMKLVDKNMTDADREGRETKTRLYNLVKVNEARAAAEGKLGQKGSTPVVESRTTDDAELDIFDSGVPVEVEASSPAAVNEVDELDALRDEESDRVNAELAVEKDEKDRAAQAKAEEDRQKRSEASKKGVETKRQKAEQAKAEAQAAAEAKAQQDREDAYEDIQKQLGQNIFEEGLSYEELMQRLQTEKNWKNDDASQRWVKGALEYDAAEKAKKAAQVDSPAAEEPSGEGPEAVAEAARIMDEHRAETASQSEDRSETQEDSSESDTNTQLQAKVDELEAKIQKMESNESSRLAAVKAIVGGEIREDISTPEGWSKFLENVPKDKLLQILAVLLVGVGKGLTEATDGVIPSQPTG